MYFPNNKAFALLRESQNTFIDMVNKAEQIELINSADDLINIRDLRNEIAHEYIEEELFEIETSSNYKKKG